MEVEGEKRAKQEEVHHFDMDTLKHFYSMDVYPESCTGTLFPAEEFYQWLTYAHGKDLSVHEDMRKRELSMTLEGDLYIRYQGYANAVYTLHVAYA